MMAQGEGTSASLKSCCGLQGPFGDEVPEASLAVVVVLFSAVVLTWLWALC